MEQKEYRRTSDDTRAVILFIHGIVGSPNHFNDLIALVPDSISVYNILLEGHGRTATDFARSSMKKWESHFKRVVDELSEKYEKIYIVAHSMGTLLSIEQAVNNSKIAELFLLSVPLKIFIKPRMVRTCAKVYINKIDPRDKYAVAARSCYGIESDINPFHYVGWIPRFFELLGKGRAVRKLAPLIKAPCTVYQSGDDETVAYSSVKYFKDNPNVSIVTLPDSGHYYYSKEDRDLLLRDFEAFVTRIKEGME